MKYKGCHHKEAMQMKLAHLNHLLENGEQVSAGNGSWTWSENNLKEKEGPTYKRPKCWWGHQPLKWEKVPTK